MRYIIPNTKQAPELRELACDAIKSLDAGKAWQIDITLYRRKRSLEQNAFLWTVPLSIISEHTGYEKEDLKDYLLERYFGTDTYEVMGKQYTRPAKGSSELTTGEFNEFLDFIERWAAQELDLVIPKPNEEV